MNMTQAARLAKSAVATVFEAENVQNIGLEEIEFDPDASRWKVTVGFSRPWNRHGEDPGAGLLTASLFANPPRIRDMKVVTLDDADGTIVSVRNRT